MRCKNCDYRLWNLTSSRCPECGRPFRPSEFEFICNSVQFCCPHCNQSYYGTGAKGHLVPVEFDCVSCGRRVHMDEMVLFPTAGVEEDRTRVDTMPWLERKKRGFFKCWFSTIGLALVAPGRLMRTVPMESSVAPAWWFVIFTNLVFLFVGPGALVLFGVIVGATISGGRGGGGTGAAVAGVAAGVGGFAFGAFVFLVILIAIGGLITHGLLRITGKTASTIGRTYQAICFSSGANVLTAIPCAGFYFGWIWWLVSAILMVRQGQKVHGGRATFAVLTFPVLSVGTLVGLWIWFVPLAVSGAGPFAAGRFRPTERIVKSVVRYAKNHEDQYPEHAILLLVEEYITSYDLVATGSDTFEEDVPVSDINLVQFDDLTQSQKEKNAQAAIDALPDGVIAHRLGDFVFTYHGIDPSTADPELWLVVFSPDPDANPSTPAFGQPVYDPTYSQKIDKPVAQVEVGRANGNFGMHVSIESMAYLLADQNTLRAKYGLPPLPDPATVTHAKPAVANEPAPTSQESTEPSS